MKLISSFSPMMLASLHSCALFALLGEEDDSPSEWFRLNDGVESHVTDKELADRLSVVLGVQVPVYTGKTTLSAGEVVMLVLQNYQADTNVGIAKISWVLVEIDNVDIVQD